MLKISRLSDYATLILSRLAQSTATSLSAAQVARETELPAPTVSKLLKKYTDANILISTRGAHGGYRLAQSAESIDLATIIEVVEGQKSLTDCLKANGHCVHSDRCNMQANWQHISAMVVDIFKNISLADMCQPFNQTRLNAVRRNINE